MITSARAGYATQKPEFCKSSRWMILFGLHTLICCLAFSPCSWLNTFHLDHDSPSLRIPSVAENKRHFFAESDRRSQNDLHAVKMCQEKSSHGASNNYRHAFFHALSCFFPLFNQLIINLFVLAMSILTTCSLPGR